MQVFYDSGVHVLKFKMPTYDEQKDIGYGGLKVWKTCEGVPESIESILRTITLITENVVFSPFTQEMFKASMNFGKKAMNLEYIER